MPAVTTRSTTRSERGERGPSLSVGHQLDPAQHPQTTDVADRWVVPELAAQGRVELGASIPCRLNEIELLQNCQHSTARGRPYAVVGVGEPVREATGHDRLGRESDG
jgi:hypothetical protein